MFLSLNFNRLAAVSERWWGYRDHEIEKQNLLAA
jgi:hypothetical protein